MRTRIVLLSAVALLGLLMASCRPESSSTARAGDAPVTLAISLPDDATVGAAEVRVRIEEDGAPVTGATVEVTGDMTHAGMMPMIAAATEAEPGIYRAETFEFTMAGDWIVTVEAELADGRTVTGEATTTVQSP